MSTATVVVAPGTVICPSCSMALHRLGYFVSHEPPPTTMPMSCLNSRCPERRLIKLVPLEVIEVEVDDAEPVEPD